jgi:chromosome partitioning protein
VIANALAVANAKGGVGKSSVAINLAGLAALSGWRTLIVDLDPQGQVAWELGVGGTDLNDEGLKLLNAVLTRESVLPITNVRPQLDIVSAGGFTENVGDQIRRAGLGALEPAIAPLAGDYDLVIFDTPPAKGSLLADAALAVSHFVIIPTKSDGGSLRGLRDMALRCAEIRATENPDLSVLGVVFFGMKSSATRRRADRRQALEQGLPAGVVVFDSFIREAAAAGDDLRDLSLLAYEYEQAASTGPKWWEVRRDGAQAKDAPRYASNAADLAGDYQQLAAEVMAAFAERLGAAV